MILEEMNETSYIDRIYLRTDGDKTVEINVISKPSNIYSSNRILYSNIIKQLLKESDDKYLLMNNGDEYQLEFIIPDNYHKIEFVAEGYYYIIKQDTNSFFQICRNKKREE